MLCHHLLCRIGIVSLCMYSPDAEQYSAIESVKAANDLYAPMSGEVTEVNNTLEDDAAMVNKSPYKEGEDSTVSS